MSAVVADTHAAVWSLVEPHRLSAAARSALDQAAKAGAPIHLASISLVEIRYLIDKGKLAPTVWDRVTQALGDPSMALTCAALDQAVAEAVRHIPRDQVPDMPDRIIAATALHLEVPLISRDRKIQASNVQTIW